MNLADATKPQVVSVESHDDDRLQILESAMGTVAAVNRFPAKFERLKEERDGLETQLADARAENEALRRNINDGEDRHDQLSKTVTALTDQMETIAARCLEAVRVVRAQIDHHSSVRQSMPAVDDQSPAGPAALPNPPIAPAKLVDGRSGLDEHGARPSTVDSKSSPIAEASRVVQVFNQYLTQTSRVTDT
jgi:FtsZ-binding cell division protein ZapB